MKIDDAIQSTFKSPQMKAAINIRYTSNYFAARQNAFMANYGISMAQFNILRILRGAKDMVSVNVVKARMVEKSPNTTRLMDKLIDKGFITRERCENDRRVVYVKISGKGLELLTEIDKCFSELNVASDKLTDDEANLLSNLLDKCRG